VIPNEGCVITVSHLGFIKRTRVSDYRSQKRGGKGIIGTETYDEDFVEHLFTASTHDFILFFTNTGQCHAKKVYDVPEGTRASKGKSVSELPAPCRGREDRGHAVREGLRGDRSTSSWRPRRGDEEDQPRPTTRTRPARAALRGIKLEEADTLVGCVLTSGQNEVILVSHKGQAVRFNEDELRDQGRDTGRGHRHALQDRAGDYVKAIEVCDRWTASSSPARTASANAPSSRTTASSAGAARASSRSTFPRTARSTWRVP
jgi:DNA gyrase subunit A